ncbi:MAG: stage III sporulation protein AF [Syntrophomonadaceae bacterium]|jgi:stage III sporulation protein AF|nr:stage III sporulation protein AF [Bacillota bacterium]NLM88839.1 stage III sporulation protein AF [Syntrophomonadaceae bacterium]HAA08828.1 stage III sporulation protein AF [Syntrophomonas sp.]HQD89779.1 stage III sporulation protein AF [Syntrophomonadaceae bacterium]
MTVLSEIVRNVLVIVLIASFLELMLPEGTLRPFVRFAIGLFILIAVLSPLAGILFSDRSINIEWWDMKINPAQQEQILQQGEKINAQIWHLDQETLADKVAGQIGAVALLVPGVEDVEAHVVLDESGSVESVQLLVRSQAVSVDEEAGRVGIFREAESVSFEEQEAIRNKLSAIIKNLYGFEHTAIEIEFQGG